MTPQGLPGSGGIPETASRRVVTGVTVVVPAHDEAQLLSSCLAAIDVAGDAVAPLPVRVVVVADDCRDDTIGVAAAFQPTVVDLDVRVVSLRRVGAARAAGLTDAPTGPGEWFATTDADSLVPPTWLTAQLASARSHDLFVGTVEVVDWSPRPHGLEAVYAPLYHSAPSHRHVHATNLGISAEMYHAAGGFRDLAAHEDDDLVRRCEAYGAVVDWSAAAPVATSARRSDRTPTGFSDYLTRLENELPA